MSLLLYGIVRSGHRTTRLQAIRDDIVTTQHKGLVVVARDGPELEALDDADALDYVDVLIELIHGGPVLPLPYGTVAPDIDTIRTDVLIPPMGHHLRMLSAIEDLVEVRIDIAFDADRAGTDRFGAWAQEHADSALSELRDIALRTLRLHPPAEGIERSGWLVQRARLEEFDAAVAAIRRGLRGTARPTYLGPMPLFDFLELVAESEDDDALLWGW